MALTPNLHRGPFLTPSLTPTLTRTRRELLTPTLTLTRRELPTTTHVPIGEVGLRRRALLRRAGKPRQAAGGDGTTAEAGLLRTSAGWGGMRGKWQALICEDDMILAPCAMHPFFVRLLYCFATKCLLCRVRGLRRRSPGAHGYRTRPSPCPETVGCCGYTLSGHLTEYSYYAGLALSCCI